MKALTWFFYMVTFSCSRSLVFLHCQVSRFPLSPSAYHITIHAEIAKAFPGTNIHSKHRSLCGKQRALLPFNNATDRAAAHIVSAQRTIAGINLFKLDKNLRRRAFDGNHSSTPGKDRKNWKVPFLYYLNFWDNIISPAWSRLSLAFTKKKGFKGIEIKKEAAIWRAATEFCLFEIGGWQHRTG